MSGCRIFIGRLNPSAREKDVERFFKGYGKIRDIDLKRGFGFVVRFAFCRQFNNIVKSCSMHGSALAAMTIHLIPKRGSKPMGKTSG
uniref:RRM domain-containing protein n=1 Tax=Sinocyclocheilus anshuiensis TaxID=1608454 RepID=A0A671KLP7_9TELE